MISDGTWPLEPVTTDDLIEIFVSKSVYHASYQKYFSKAQKYPQIIAWLLNDQDSPTSHDVFGLQKSVYTFKDLRALLESLDASSGKKRKTSDEDGERERKNSTLHWPLDSRWNYVESSGTTRNDLDWTWSPGGVPGIPLDSHWIPAGILRK